MKSHQFCLQQREWTHTIMCQPQVTKAASRRFCNKPACVRECVCTHTHARFCVFQQYPLAFLDLSFVYISIPSNVNCHAVLLVKRKNRRQFKKKEQALDHRSNLLISPSRMHVCWCIMGLFCVAFRREKQQLIWTGPGGPEDHINTRFKRIALFWSQFSHFLTNSQLSNVF